MKIFTDAAARQWSLIVNVNSIKRARDLASVNLLTVIDDGCKTLAQLHDDPITLVNVLYAVCKPQADAAGISDEQFGEAMYGDAIFAGLTALLDELQDFFPNPQQRAAIKTLRAKLGEVVAAMHKHAIQAIEAVESGSTAEKLIASFGKSADISA